MQVTWYYASGRATRPSAYWLRVRKGLHPWAHSGVVTEYVGPHELVETDLGAHIRGAGRRGVLVAVLGPNTRILRHIVTTIAVKTSSLDASSPSGASRPNTLTTYSYGGISFQYPASWQPTPESGQQYIYQIQGPGAESTLSFHVYDQSDRSPSSPLWFLGKYRVLPDDAKTWSNGQGGIDYQARAGDYVTVGIVQPIPSRDPGTAFNLSIQVLRSRTSYAWQLLNTWRFGAAANRATLTGSTNQYGDPAFKVTVVGPKGSITTFAVLDTGNEGPVLINPRLARAVGLPQTGTQTSCGVNGCAREPTYSRLSVAPAGSSNWMVANGSAIGWHSAGIDLGTNFLRYATETDSNGHWTITWAVQ